MNENLTIGTRKKNLILPTISEENSNLGSSYICNILIKFLFDFQVFLHKFPYFNDAMMFLLFPSHLSWMHSTIFCASFWITRWIKSKESIEGVLQMLFASRVCCCCWSKFCTDDWELWSERFPQPGSLKYGSFF